MTSVFPDKDLTEAEADLLRAYGRGEHLDFAQEPSADSLSTASLDGTRKIIHASVIHRLLLWDIPAEPGSLRQLDIAGACIKGPLDLRFARIDCPLRFTSCVFDSPVTLSEARLRSVSLHGCRIPGVDAQHVTVNGDLVLTKACLRGPLRLSGAHLEDDLHLDGADISAPGSEPALDLDNIDVKGKIDANGMIVGGTVRMESACVAGTLRIKGATIDANAPAGVGADPGAAAGIAWYGDGMTVQGEVDASGMKATGMVSLIAARVLDLVLRNVRINSTGTALMLDRLEARGTVCCDDGTDLTGGLRAVGINVGDTLCLRNGTMRAALDEAAVDLRHARIAENLFCAPGFHTVGRLDLTGARVGGEVDLDRASLEPADWDGDKWVLIADRAEIAGLSARDFIAAGAMRLVNARIGGTLTFRHAADPSQADTGLNAQGMSIRLNAQGVSVTHDAVVNTAGTVQLGGAAISGNLTIDLGRLRGPDQGAAADLAFITAGVLTLNRRAQHGLLDLTRASVRLLSDNPDYLTDDTPAVLDGFQYGDIAGLGAASPHVPKEEQRTDQQAQKKSTKTELSARLRWLEAGTRFARSSDGQYTAVGFTPQPYQQLAAVYQRIGREQEARKVLRTMYQRRNSVKTPRGLSKLWNLLQDWLVGYGYAPWRALSWLLVFAAITSAAVFWLGDEARLGIARTMLLPLGLLLPGTAYQNLAPWDPAVSIWSHAIAAVLVLFGLILGATVLAALARIIRR